jgi:hypothetical protein
VNGSKVSFTINARIISYWYSLPFPRNVSDITGLKVEEFQKVVEKVRPEWKKNRVKKEMPWKEVKFVYDGRQDTMCDFVLSNPYHT